MRLKERNPITTMNLYDEFFALISYLNKLGARYAVIGGVAMAFYGIPRFTHDVDILLHPDDLSLAKMALERLNYRESAEPRTFSNTNLTLHRFLKVENEDELMFNILIANAAEYQEMICNAVETASNAGTVRVALKRDLITLKKSPLFQPGRSRYTGVAG